MPPRPPALHGSWGVNATGGREKFKLLSDWMTGFRAHVQVRPTPAGGGRSFGQEHGLADTLVRFVKDKEVRYMLPYVKKVGEDKYGNQYFEDNGTPENPQMKTRQRCGWKRGGGLSAGGRIVRYGGDNNKAVFDMPYETSVIPPDWYAWVHHMDDRLPEMDENGVSIETLAPAATKFVKLEAGTAVEAMTEEPYKHLSEYRANPTTKVPQIDVVTGEYDSGAQYYQPGHLRGGNHRIQTYQSWQGGQEAKTHIKTHGGVPVAQVQGDSSQI